MNNIVYRKATIEDAYDIEFVASYSWKETYYDLMPNDYLNTRIENIATRAERTKEFLKNTNDYWVAIVNGKIIGILYYSHSKEEKYKNYGYLGAIYILKDYQGMGIGRELFKIAIENLIRFGYNDMYLECLKGNPTMDFYEHFGGRIIDTVDYPIHNFSVRADIVEFNNLNMILNKIKNNVREKHKR